MVVGPCRPLVDEIEEGTGLDLLSSLPESIVREVERAQAPKRGPQKRVRCRVSAVVVPWIGSSRMGSLSVR